MLVANWPYGLFFIQLDAFVSVEDPSMGCPFLLKCLPLASIPTLNAGCFIIAHLRKMRLLLTGDSFLYGR